MKREYDYSKLKGRITEKVGNLQNFAKHLNISGTALHNKLESKVAFKQDEIMIAIQPECLDIDPTEICKYFFTLKVGKNQTR